MTIGEKIAAIWASDAVALALVPAARFKVDGDYESMAAPYVLQYAVAERAPEQTHTGPIGAIRIWEFYQLSIHCASYTSGFAIAEKVRTLFYGNHEGVQFAHLGNRWGGKDADTGLGLWIAQFRIAENLTA